jgi:hypothetical protein
MADKLKDLGNVSLRELAHRLSTLIGAPGGTTANHTLDSINHTDVATITEAEGQLFYYDDTSNWNALDPGNSGELLKTQGANNPPVWASLGEAPDDAQYLVLQNTGDLSAERKLVIGDGLTGSDSGANDDYTINLDHLGLEDLTDPGVDRIFGWDNSASKSDWLSPNDHLEISGTNLNVTPNTINLDDLNNTSLTDPDADRIVFWDDSDGTFEFLAASGGLTISTNSLNLDWGTPTITTIQPDDSADAGTSTNPTRSNHQHAIVCAAPSTLNPDQSNTEGTSTSFARADHIHNVPTATPSTLNPDQSNAEGTATSFARADHIHNVPAATPGAIEPDDSAAEGSSTSFARADHQHSIVAAVPERLQPDAAQAEGTASSFARSDHGHQITCAAPSTALSVSTTNAEGASSYNFSRSDHSHAITTSSNPGSNASILASDSNGRLELEGLGIGASPTGQELRVDGDLVFIGAQTITNTTGQLTISTDDDDLLLSPSGDVLTDSTIAADNWVSGTTGWGVN